jgi:hypothetical protein
MIDREFASQYVTKRQSKNPWRGIGREAVVLGCTPVWQLMLGAGIWPGRLMCRRRGFRF